MKTISKWFTKAVDWIVLSSADPKKSSLTVRMLLLGGVAWGMNTISQLCGFGIACFAVDSATVNQLVEYAVQIVFLVLSLIAVLGSAYGLTRKIANTATNSQYK